MNMCEDSKENQVYSFKVSMRIPKRKIYREMALKGSTSLYDFADFILSSFDFQLDHAFGFYSNIQSTYDSTEAYTLFKDEGGPLEPNEKSVKHSFIHEVFEPGRTMLFHFDYGDDWEFLVECCATKRVRPDLVETYPKVTKKQGEAPPQYPPNSDEDEDDDEDD